MKMFFNMLFVMFVITTDFGFSSTLIIETFRTLGYQVDYFDQPTAVFRIQMYATAVDGDCYIRGGLLLDGEQIGGITKNVAHLDSVFPTTFSSGVCFSFFPEAGLGVYNYVDPKTGVLYAGDLWKIDEGKTLEMELTLYTRSQEDTYVKFGLDSIEYSGDPNWTDVKSASVGAESPYLRLDGTRIPESSTSILTLFFWEL